MKQATVSAYFTKKRKPEQPADNEKSSKRITSDSVVADKNTKKSRNLLIAQTRLKFNYSPASQSEETHSDSPSQTPPSLEKPIQKASNKSPIQDEPKKKKQTPLEQQFDILKKQYPDIILLIEVGYRYVILGDDALKAAQSFRFNLSKSSEPRVSFPSQVLKYRIKKLIDDGHKVGLVEQIETKALKEGSGLFERKLAKIYTKGTWMEDDVRRFVMGITETKTGWAFLAVEPGVGRIITDEFSDTQLMSELDTRLSHIRPCEIVVLGNVNKTVLKMFKRVSSEPRIVNVEPIPPVEIDIKIEKYYLDLGDDGPLRHFAASLAPGVKKCLVALIDYFRPFQLDSVFALTKNFESFKLSTTVSLNANTIESLEIFNNLTDHSSKGSLFWCMDHTRTPFGSRLLQKWIANPLLEKHAIENRMFAVTELLKGFAKHPVIEKVTGFMKGLRDLEKDLINIYYGRCSARGLYAFLKKMHTLGNILQNQNSFNFKSPILNSLFGKFSAAYTISTELLSELREEGANNNDNSDLFHIENHPSLEELHLCILMVHSQLESELQKQKTETGIRNLKYVTVANLTYLLEVSQADNSKVPNNWIKFSQLRGKARYRSPQVIELVKEVEKAQDRLKLESDATYHRFLKKVANNTDEFRTVISSLAHFDCLVSLAAIAGTPGYVKPEIINEPGLNIRGARHPVIEQLLPPGSQYIPNTIQLRAGSGRSLVLMGPNMGGKSSYARTVALFAIMAQVGSYVPAQWAQIGPHDAVFVRMGARDDLFRGQSTFHVELSEVSTILKDATDRSLIVLDEVGRGTSTLDGVAIAGSVLSYFENTVKANLVFVTHYTGLGKGEGRRMGWMKTEDDRFIYRFVESDDAPGSYGMKVARMAGIPENIVKHAEEKAHNLEVIIHNRQNRRKIEYLGEFVNIVMGNAVSQNQNRAKLELLLQNV